jgi:hypothetical protein
VDQYDEELILLRNNIHEEFYQNYLILLFNTLGNYEFKDQYK